MLCCILNKLIRHGRIFYKRNSSRLATQQCRNYQFVIYFNLEYLVPPCTYCLWDNDSHLVRFDEMLGYPNASTIAPSMWFAFSCQLHLLYNVMLSPFALPEALNKTAKRYPTCCRWNAQLRIFLGHDSHIRNKEISVDDASCLSKARQESAITIQAGCPY